MAPGAEKRSVICDVIAALCADASRSSWPTRDPMRRAGITNSGSRTTASTVICHDRLSITTSVSTSVMTFVTTPASADVNAPWAPITSLFRRLTRAPVWVRVKKAIGIDCTCSNTRRRRSRIRRSPRRDDSSRSSRPTPRVDDGDDREQHGQPDDHADVAAVDDGVDGTPGEHRRGHAEQGRHRGQGQEGDDRPAVRAGERGHPPPRRPVDAAAGSVVLHRALERGPHLEVGHGADVTTSSSLEVKAAGRAWRAVTPRRQAATQAAALS